jgi:Domain of unknown function (DUF4388)
MTKPVENLPVTGVWSGLAALEVLELFRSRPRPNSVVVCGSFGRKGYLGFSAGNLVYAKTPTSAGLAAVAELLTWVGAEFESSAKAPTEANIATPYMATILDVLERIGEPVRVTPITASEGIPVFQARDRVTTPRLHSDPDYQRKTTLQNVVAADTDPEDSAEDITDDLIEITVERSAPPAAPPPLHRAVSKSAANIEVAVPPELIPDALVGAAPSELSALLSRLPCSVSWAILAIDGRLLKASGATATTEAALIDGLWRIYESQLALVGQLGVSQVVHEITLQTDTFWLLRPWQDLRMVVYGPGGPYEYAQLHYQLKQIF